MILRPPRSTRTDTLFPYTTLFRSVITVNALLGALIDAMSDMPHDYEIPSPPSRMVDVFADHLACARPQPYGLKRPRDSRLRRVRSEEHTSELQSLMRISYAVFCLKKNKTIKRRDNILT